MLMARWRACESVGTLTGPMRHNLSDTLLALISEARNYGQQMIDLATLEYLVWDTINREHQREHHPSL